MAQSDVHHSSKLQPSPKENRVTTTTHDARRTAGRKTALSWLSAVLFVAVGCAGSDSIGGGKGGSTATGGTVGSGGTTASGRGGTTSTGGGGTISTGGTGAATGGSDATGGGGATAGSAATGGSGGTGGLSERADRPPAAAAAVRASAVPAERQAREGADRPLAAAAARASAVLAERQAREGADRPLAAAAARVLAVPLERQAPGRVAAEAERRPARVHPRSLTPRGNRR